MSPKVRAIAAMYIMANRAKSAAMTLDKLAEKARAQGNK